MKAFATSALSIGNYLHKIGWIDKTALVKQAEPMKDNQFGKHLLNVVEGIIEY